MERTSLIACLWKSWYSPALYQEIYARWRYRILALMVLLCLITSLPALIQSFHSTQQLRTNSHKIIEQLPTLRFDSQCLLAIDKPSPYSIQLPNSDKALIVFDTEASSQDLAQYQPLFLSLGKTGFYLRGKTSINSLRQFKPYQDYQRGLANLSLTPEQLVRALHYLVLAVGVIIYGLTVLSTLLSQLLFGLLLAFVAMVIGLLSGFPLRLGQAFRLSLLAQVPAALLEAGCKSLALSEPAWFDLLLCVLCFGYLAFIMRQLKAQSDHPVKAT